MRLILASASPRRRRYLEEIGVEFSVRPSGADETPPEGASPAEAARLIALRKALDVAGENPASAVLAADTVVELGGELLGKPADAKDARRMLAALSGRSHNVHTGVALVRPGAARSLSVTTEVVFANLSEGEIGWYVASGEPLDKAGAYGIQGLAAGFVREIRGSYTNVVGLPLAQTLEMLEEAGLAPWSRNGKR